MESSAITPSGNTSPAPGRPGVLSEDAIKKAFIPYLKSFYKYRYEFQPETLETALDNVSESGLVADGMLRFRKTDGAYFTCTYEATSLEKSGEVKYVLNVVYFLWDCLAFGMLLAAVVYAWFYAVRLPWLAGLQAPGNIGLLLGMSGMGFLAWYFTMQKWRKYRYIYAIEQFKHYFADEQWIAIGADVFIAPHDPYMEELKRQCVYNGFGLAVVNWDGAVRTLSTPSRLGIFGKDRRMVHWVTRSDWYQIMSKNVAVAAKTRPPIPEQYKILWNKLWRPIQYNLLQPARNLIWNALRQPLQTSAGGFDRYMKGHDVQKWIFGIGLTLILLLGYRVLNFTEENYVDPEALIRQTQQPNPEDEPGYIIDEEPVPYQGGVPKQYPSQKQPKKEEPEEDIQIINLSGDE
jgi:hypothetical protein